MRKAIAILGMTGALTVGGAGIANASDDILIPTTTTISAQSEASEDDGGDNGLWGLAGLLGLLGLLGLKRRNDVVAHPAAGGYSTGTTPRA